MLLHSSSRALRELGATVLAMFRMLADRRYPLSFSTTATLVVGLAYFLSPVDVVPDAIPIVGFLDDAAVLAELGVLLSSELRSHAMLRAREHESPENAL